MKPAQPRPDTRRQVSHLTLGAGTIVDRDTLDPDLLADLLDCGAPGDIADAVDHVVRTYPIHYDPDALRRHLRASGWLRVDLLDDDLNLRRTIWLLGSFLREGHEIVSLEE